MPAIALHCSGCKDPFRVIASQAGMKVRCPRCGHVNLVSVSAFSASSRGDKDTPAPARASSDVDTVATSTPAPQSARHKGGDPLSGLADAVRQTKRPISMRDVYGTRVTYTHSALAKVSGIAAQIILLTALLVEVYVLITTEWSLLADLPFKLALPAFALTILPASSIAVTGLFLLLTAHGVEYLAKMSSEIVRY